MTCCTGIENSESRFNVVVDEFFIVLVMHICNDLRAVAIGRQLTCVGWLDYVTNIAVPLMEIALSRV